MFFIALGGIVVGALVRQRVLEEVGVHLGRRPVEDGVHFEAVELRVPHEGGQRGGPLRVLFATQRGDPHFGGQFTHAALERLQLHDAAEGFDTLDFVRHRHLAAIQRQPMRSGHEWQVGLQIQRELGAALFGETVGFRQICAVVDPEHRNVGIGLRDQMQDHGLVGAKIRRHGRLAIRVSEGEGDFDDFRGRFAFGVIIEGGELFRVHGRGAIYSPNSRCVK